MRGRRTEDPLREEDCLDASLRKKVFRDLGGDLTRSMREGYVTDAPGKIASLMEKAFRMGAELGQREDFSVSRTDTVRDITDMDVPSAPRQSLGHMRIYFGISPFLDEPRRKLSQSGSKLGLIMRPRDRRLPSTMSKDDWLMPTGYGKEYLTFSNKSVLPLVKMGLLAEPRELGGGWKATYFTEWGFELLLTGKTAGPDSRKKGKSSTIAEYASLVREGDGPMAEAGYAIGVFQREQPEEPKP